MAITLERTTIPLTGEDLLQKVKELSHLSRRETAKRCGYYSQGKDGQVRINLTDFYDAILAARGIPLDPEDAQAVREPKFRLRVQKNGQIIIGSAYTKQMGLKPGDEFEIKLGYKHIRLTQVESELDQEYLETSEILSWEEIVKKYPDQWLLIIDFELDKNLNIIRGNVIANSSDNEQLYEQLSLRQGKPFAIEYTRNVSSKARISV